MIENVIGLGMMFLLGVGFLLFGVILVYSLLSMLIEHIRVVHTCYLNLTFTQYRAYIDAVNSFLAYAAKMSKAGGSDRPPRFDVGEDPDDPDVDSDFDDLDDDEEGGGEP